MSTKKKKKTFFWIAPIKLGSRGRDLFRESLWARPRSGEREREGAEGKLKQEVETGGLFVFFCLFAIAFAPALFYLYFYDKT